MQYTVIKSNRKTVALEITRECEIVVRCPRRMTNKDADIFVKKHMDWIEKHLIAVRKRLESRVNFDFTSGQEIYFLGEKHVINIREGISQAEISGREMLVPDLPTDGRREAVKKLFSRRLAELLPAMTDKWASETGLVPAGIKITDAKTRWGSCSGKNRVCFSWRLAFLSAELIEYVVLHELCHIKHHNHSKDFYALLGSFMPDFRERIATLRRVKETAVF